MSTAVLLCVLAGVLFTAVAAQNISTGICYSLASCNTGGVSISANTFDDCCKNISATSFTSNGDGDLAGGCYDCQDANIPPMIIISPSTIQGAMVGNGQTIQCLAMTNVTLSVNSVEFTWISPDGSYIVNDSRLTINQTDAQYSNYTSVLQFDYLMEGDEGNYTCNVTTLIFNVIGVETAVIQTLNIPTPTVTVTELNNINHTVGQSLLLDCSVTTVRGITSGLDIMWSDSNGMVIKTISGANISSTTNTSQVYTDIYTISLVSLDDDGESYLCEAVLNASMQIMVDNNITLDVTIPTPTVNVTALNNQTVGQSLMLECNVTTVRGINRNVNIMWSVSNGSNGTVIKTINGVNTSSTTSTSLVYTDIYTISILSVNDDGEAYVCEAVIDTSPQIMVDDDITLDVTIPTPTVNVTALNNQTVGQSLMLECNVTTVRGINRNVNITWSVSNGTVIKTINSVNTSSTTSTSLVYTDIYTISILSVNDDDEAYVCEAVIDTSPQIMVDDDITLDVIIPDPNVSVIALNSQMVGNSIILECNVTTIRELNASVDIMWSSSDGTVLRSTNGINVSSTTIASLVYTDYYTVTQHLNTTDHGILYQCASVINGTMNTYNFTIDVIVPAPIVSISPSNTIQGLVINTPQDILCMMSTVDGVNSSSVVITWMGPGGTTVTSSSRVIVNSANSTGGNNYTSSLQFVYLAESDAGTYSCNVTILSTTASASVSISSLIVPTAPNVSVTIIGSQTVGQPLMLECNITTLRGVTSDTDVTWYRSGMRVRNVSMVSSNIMGDTQVYTDLYTISPLSTTDDGGVYLCNVFINSSPQLMANDSVTFTNVTVPQPSINTLQSMEGSISGLNSTLTCSVMAAGVPLHLMMVNWIGGSSLSESPRVNVSDLSNSMSLYTRTVTFSPLLNDDAGQYNCSVSVTGYDEATTSSIVMVDVDAPNLTHSAAPGMIVGNVGQVSIGLSCIVSVVENIASILYYFTWMRNGLRILPNNRIMITTTSNMSSLDINMSDSNATLDNGEYTCQITATVSGRDNFTETSDPMHIILTASSPPLIPVLRSVVITPYSAIISWVVTSIVYDNETYSVQYGMDMMALQNTSQDVMGNSYQFAINDVFSVNIMGLTPFTIYYYIIWANNSLGNTSTATTSFISGEIAPTAAPSNLRATNIISNSITFGWDALTSSEAKGIIRWYEITCADGTGNNYTANITGADRTGTVSGLTPFNDYNCTIYAFTVSDGPISDPTNVITAEGASSPPVINTVTTINSSVIHVSWSRPTILNGIITMYTITYDASGDTRNIDVNYNGQQMQSYNITGLAPYQLIRVTITAINGGGRSDPSNEVSGRTGEEVPGVVDQFSTVQYIVSWSPPSQPNGIITGYQVIYFVYANRTATEMMSAILSNTTTQYSIQNLGAGVAYQVVVVAYTSVGKGAENDSHVFFGEELSPTKPPDNVDFDPLNVTSVNVTWTPLTLFEARGFPEYRVTIAPLNNHGGESGSRSIVVRDSYSVVADLMNNTYYLAVVGVRTGASASFMNSSAITVNTGNITTPSSGGIISTSPITIGVLVAIMTLLL